MVDGSSVVVCLASFVLPLLLYAVLFRDGIVLLSVV